jgi:hypothetical protein
MLDPPATTTSRGEALVEEEGMTRRANKDSSSRVNSEKGLKLEINVLVVVRCSTSLFVGVGPFRKSGDKEEGPASSMETRVVNHNNQKSVGVIILHPCSASKTEHNCGSGLCAYQSLRECSCLLGNSPLPFSSSVMVFKTCLLLVRRFLVVVVTGTWADFGG